MSAAGHGVSHAARPALASGQQFSLDDDADPARRGAGYPHDSHHHAEALAHAAPRSRLRLAVSTSTRLRAGDLARDVLIWSGHRHCLDGPDASGTGLYDRFADHLRHATAAAARAQRIRGDAERLAGQSSCLAGFYPAHGRIPKPVPAASITLRYRTADGGSPGVGRRRVWFTTGLDSVASAASVGICLIGVLLHALVVRGRYGNRAGPSPGLSHRRRAHHQ